MIPGQFQKEMRDFTDDRLHFHDNLDKLRRTHPKEWVAVRGK